MFAGDTQGVKDLVESGEIDVNEKGAQDRTALHRQEFPLSDRGMSTVVCTHIHMYTSWQHELTHQKGIMESSCVHAVLRRSSSPDF